MSKVHFTLKSGNAKTGPIPVSISERSTCPDTCSFKGNGCYAEGWPLRLHWDKVPERGVEWPEFTSAVAALPEGTVWRHNAAGDLPKADNGTDIDQAKLDALVAANAAAGARGFTYTHHTMTSRANRAAVADANLRGFTVNVSCDNFAEVDNIGLGLPTVVVLPALDKGQREPKVTYTPGGIKVVTCPAQYQDKRTCANCELCQRADRKYAIGFRAHGPQHKKVSTIVAANQLNRSKRA